MVHPKGIEPLHLVPETNALSTELRVHNEFYYKQSGCKNQMSLSKFLVHVKMKDEVRKMDQSLGLRLSQEQTQKLVMNQEMRQAITILQYTSLELADFIQKEIEENPLFEFDLSKTSIRSDTDSPYPDPIVHLAKKNETLEKILLEQISYQPLTARQRKIGRYLIGLLDEDGYFREEIGRVAQELDCAEDEVEEMLGIIQTFEPIGVGARNLAECILIQIRAKGRLTPLIEQLITQHLHMIAERKYALLSQIYGVSVEEIETVVALIEQSYPRPGLLYAEPDVKYIVPDLFVEMKDGEIVLSLNDQILPRLRINEEYLQMLRRSEDQAAKSFLRERLKKALWMIKSIEQRGITILKVADAIFRHQREFLSKGDLALKPLTLREIAQEIGVHESTVSRTVNQKYVQTSRGLYELKHFFVRGIHTSAGALASSIWIKNSIQSLIDLENKEKPLSDQEIADYLNREGIQISRRTVMKYREEMKIPSSNKRRMRS